jgi:hypothetical protein
MHVRGVEVRKRQHDPQQDVQGHQPGDQVDAKVRHLLH